MVMTTNGARDTAVMKPPPVVQDDVFRLSPVPADGSLYKCPVSTPMYEAKRPLHHVKIPESLKFVSIDCSQIENTPRHTIHRPGTKVSSKFKSPFRHARKKNFDYYYVDKKFQTKLSGFSNTTWLKSLCSQPVDEIFGKYRPNATPSASRQPSEGRVSRNFSTPGEMAIKEAWEVNSLKRIGSATSRASRLSKNSQLTERTASPNLTIISKPYVRPHSDRVDSRVDTIPHPPSLGNTEENSRAPSRGSFYITKDPDDPIDFHPYINSTSYDLLKQKDRKLPDIHKNRRVNGSVPTQRKYLTNTSGYGLARRAAPVMSFSGSVKIFDRIPSPRTDSRNNCTLCALNDTKHKH
ncbi:uncharacterized protein LOC110455122 [Mizuhopecten yessoensis]|uniref:Uncharacterized protein n=1 Tax=Mizuhopecten yessoensis TaxID=6573 RepID=A0A210QDM4_MIZYE|nr:uncharacterized protein LOC110455122 [Mizuhopecten yessoensis]XP_021360748.1 uncharacterized protein LOC110455122 [Mizuhopecten yessoensis]OWF46854.1 hypothetical protein KP79_PYT07097 [Mizuhopecten yessoensis]